MRKNKFNVVESLEMQSERCRRRSQHCRHQQAALHLDECGLDHRRPWPLQDPNVPNVILKTPQIFKLFKQNYAIFQSHLFRSKIDPGYKVETTIKILPEKVGKFTIMVDVESAQAIDIKNFATIEVIPLVGS